MMRANGGRFSWKGWSPRVGMFGRVVHYWLPNHPDQRLRSHVNHTLYLIEIGDYYVPVGESGVQELLPIRENFTMNATDDAFNTFVKKCKLHRRNAIKKSHDSTTRSPPVEKFQKPLPSPDVSAATENVMDCAMEATAIDINNRKDEVVKENIERTVTENEDSRVGSDIDKQKDTETHDDQQQYATSSDV